MKQFVLLLALAFTFVLSNYGQEEDSIPAVPPPPPPLDTIIKVEGKVMPVDVIKVTSTYVRFKVPDNDELFTIPRKEIHKILYGNGRVEDYYPLVMHVFDDTQWQAVWLTEDKADILDMHKRGSIKAHSEASFRSVKAAKKNATMKLQKKAAAIQGQVIYVTKRQSTGGYGELNGYLIEGVAYGAEPLPEEEE